MWARSPGWGVVDRPEEGPHGGSLYAAALDAGVIHVLQGPAAATCRAALPGRALTEVRDAIAHELGADPSSVDEEALEELLVELVEVGVLRREGAPVSA